MSILVRRSATVLDPDQRRVLLRPFRPGGPERIASIIGRILSLEEEDVGEILDGILNEFSPRHENLHAKFQERFEQVRLFFWSKGEWSQNRQWLIGAYFLAEYSLESAALFNPCMVAHVDQSQVENGSVRFLMSMRATGEGHISSITFRTGIVGHDLGITVDPVEGFVTEPKHVTNPTYEKALFQRKLSEMGMNDEFSHGVLKGLEDSFSLNELRERLIAEQFRSIEGLSGEEQRISQAMWLLARSNFEVLFFAEQAMAERVLFPATPAQRNGIEDARFVRFVEGDGRVKYYATFTAYDGNTVMPELLETDDFMRFRFRTLNGHAARNKGMALFPRRIRGRFVMLGRQDNESISLMYSDNIHFWNESQPLLLPRFAWELTQIGNCGPPMETEAGWLVLSHGVGPMRTYCIGAFLLDLEDPSHVIGRLKQPLLRPNADEREGYVPNVVYSCGAMIHAGHLILPYGMADHSTGFATIALDSLLAAMQ